jgi:hypothetical protein
VSEEGGGGGMTSDEEAASSHEPEVLQPLLAKHALLASEDEAPPLLGRSPPGSARARRRREAMVGITAAVAGGTLVAQFVGGRRWSTCLPLVAGGWLCRTHACLANQVPLSWPPASQPANSPAAVSPSN